MTMDIMIKLTNEQIDQIAVAIIARSRAVPEQSAQPTLPVKNGKWVDKVASVVFSLPRHEQFRSSTVADALDVTTTKVSNPLSRLEKRGFVRMIHRGLWERVK